jgi:predicted MFS family arabinose efflux permease
VTDSISCDTETVNVWRATCAGLCASLVGIGLARFAYTPLIPALVQDQWFLASQAAYLGAANLAGYLAGALAGRWMVAQAAPAAVLRAMMVLASAAFFACAFPLSFLWFFLWRFAAGLSGGALMVLAAPTILPHVPPARRGFVSGAIFAGVGVGIALSGTLVPLLLESGLVAAWCGLGVLAFLLTVLSWGGWPTGAAGLGAAPPARREDRPRAGPALKALYLEYGLNAAGLVPHMVFLVDFIARGLGQGLVAGAAYWVLFGVGATAGPVLFGHLADRVGFARTLRLGFVVQIATVALPVLATGTASLAASSLVVGAFVPGIVPLVLGRVHELMPGDAWDRQAAWSFATAAFALGQAVAAYGLSFLFARTGGYTELFEIGVAVLALALAVDLAVTRSRRAA